MTKETLAALLLGRNFRTRLDALIEACHVGSKVSLLDKPDLCRTTWMLLHQGDLSNGKSTAIRAISCFLVKQTSVSSSLTVRMNQLPMKAQAVMGHFNNKQWLYQHNQHHVATLKKGDDIRNKSASLHRGTKMTQCKDCFVLSTKMGERFYVWSALE